MVNIHAPISWKMIYWKFFFLILKGGLNYQIEHHVSCPRLFSFYIIRGALFSIIYFRYSQRCPDITCQRSNLWWKVSVRNMTSTIMILDLSKAL
jgi:hypothetical protein